MEEKDRIVSSYEIKKELETAPKQAFFSTGMKYLDELTGKIAEGDLIILGGVAKSGKTTLLRTLTYHLAEQKIATCWFSYELPYQELLSKFPEPLPTFYLPRLLTSNRLDWIFKKTEEAIKKYKAKIFFIDHLEMLTDEYARENNYTHLVSAMIRKLKRFAIANHIAVIAVQPFSKRKASSSPSSEDFRSTIMASYDADTLLAITRLTGRRKEKAVQDIIDEDADLIIPTEANLYILDCRRTGSRKIYIKLYFEDNLLKEVE